MQQGSSTSTVGPGSSGNVIAALASFVFPGLGQLVQGRLVAALIHFVFAAVWWFIFILIPFAFPFGWVANIWSAVDAAWWKGQR